MKSTTFINHNKKNAFSKEKKFRGDLKTYSFVLVSVAVTPIEVYCHNKNNNELSIIFLKWHFPINLGERFIYNRFFLLSYRLLARG